LVGIRAVLIEKNLISQSMIRERARPRSPLAESRM